MSYRVRDDWHPTALLLPVHQCDQGDTHHRCTRMYKWSNLYRTCGGRYRSEPSSPADLRHLYPAPQLLSCVASWPGIYSKSWWGLCSWPAHTTSFFAEVSSCTAASCLLMHCCFLLSVGGHTPVGLATARGLAEIAAGVLGTAATWVGGSRRQAVERLGQRRRLRAWPGPARGRPAVWGGGALRCWPVVKAPPPQKKKTSTKKIYIYIYIPTLEPHQGTGYQLARTAPLYWLNRGRPSVLWGDSWTPTWPSCRGTQKAGGCPQCVVRVRERIAPNAGSARALLM
jgi:hypothetical protein